MTERYAIGFLDSLDSLDKPSTWYLDWWGAVELGRNDAFSHKRLLRGLARILFIAA